MKIRRKAAKLPPSASPLYIVGYTGSLPLSEELALWFDLEYGGPLRIKPDSGPSSEPTSLLRATHGPWETAVRLCLSAAEADAWATSLGWRHTQVGLIALPRAAPGKAIDLVLHAARLARGFVLLTDGTAYDVSAQTYLNPSDWTDRPLTQFIARDHMTVEHGDPDDAGRERFYTQGLSKFGLDELEVFRPMALSSRSTLERLAEIAEAILRLGRSPAVGTTLSLSDIGVTLSIVKHRTVPSAQGPVAVREIAWGQAGEESSA